MSPSGSECIRQIKEQIDEVDPPRSTSSSATASSSSTSARPRSSTPATCPAPSTSRAATSSPASRTRSPTAAQHVVLYCASGNRSRAGRQHAAGGPRLRERRVDDRRHHAVEGPRLRGRGPQALTAEQRERYSRHLLLPEVGVEGQQKLLDAKVLLLGAGGLGSPTALYLAAAGVGTLGIVDDDVVDLSNLQRQVIHTTDRVGVPKVDSAEETINALNPDVNVVKYQIRLDASNIMEIIEGYDVVVDGVDNFPTRYLLNDASVRLKIPVVSAAILGFDGQLSVFAPYEGPCYRCLFREPPPAELAPSCGANGVLGVLPGTMGLLQATEAVKLIIGAGRPADRAPAALRRARRHVTEVKVRRDPECPICSREPDVDLRRRAGRLPGLRGVLRRCRVASAPLMATVKIPPVLRASVGRREGAQRRRRQRRRRPARPGRRAPGDRGAALPPTASSTATSTSTSTTRTCACSTASTRRSASRDTLVILPAMAGGR